MGIQIAILTIMMLPQPERESNDKRRLEEKRRREEIGNEVKRRGEEKRREEKRREEKTGIKVAVWFSEATSLIVYNAHTVPYIYVIYRCLSPYTSAPI